jgi:Family of unknown function (DUF5681)
MLQQKSTKPQGKPGRPKGSGPTPASWVKGQSGNPGGAPVTERTRIANALVRAADEHREALVAKVIEQALDGCQNSQRLIFERFLGPVRAQTAPVAIEGIASGSVESRLEAVLAAASVGKISSDEAAVLTGAIRAATEAASLASLERELQSIREMRAQALLANPSGTHQEGLQALEMAEEVPRHER